MHEKEAVRITSCTATCAGMCTTRCVAVCATLSHGRIRSQEHRKRMEYLDRGWVSTHSRFRMSGLNQKRLYRVGGILYHLIRGAFLFGTLPDKSLTLRISKSHEKTPLCVGSSSSSRLRLLVSQNRWKGGSPQNS